MEKGWNFIKNVLACCPIIFVMMSDPFFFFLRFIQVFLDNWVQVGHLLNIQLPLFTIIPRSSNNVHPWSTLVQFCQDQQRVQMMIEDAGWVISDLMSFSCGHTLMHAKLQRAHQKPSLIFLKTANSHFSSVCIFTPNIYQAVKWFCVRDQNHQSLNDSIRFFHSKH